MTSSSGDNSSYDDKDDGFDNVDVKKDIAQSGKKNKFVPTYDVVSLVLLGFGNTIGSGVFTLTGVAAKLAGPSVFIGFIIAGLVALATAMVFAEFASIIPKSGSAYVYAYTTLGELPAWIVGWN